MPLTAPIQSFRGNPFVTVTSITPGITTYSTSVTGVPAFFYLSASDTTAAGPSTFNAYEDLEYRWNVIDGTEGYHYIDTPWISEIYNGAVGATQKNSETDQIGPEAAFRFFNTGTKTVQLTVRGSNGSGGYISATANMNLTINQITITGHYWFDSDSGVNSNDGKDPWGFGITNGSLSGANITPGLYKITSKISSDAIIIDASTNDFRTLNATGKFATYDHTGASSLDPIRNYNYIGILAGTAAGGIMSSNGPKGNTSGSIWGNLKSNLVMHYRGGNTLPHDLIAGAPGNNTRNLNTVRFIGYGITTPTFQPLTFTGAGNGYINFNIASPAQKANNIVYHNLSVDVSPNPILLFIASSSTTANAVENVVLSNITARGLNSNWSTVQNTGVTNSPFFGIWGCDFRNGTGATSTHVILTARSNYLYVIGNKLNGVGSNLTLHHHIYPDFTEKGHSIFKWNDFGTGPGRNYCINMNASVSVSGQKSNYHLISENNMSGVLRAWDASNSSNNWAETVSKGRFANFISDGNYVNGLAGDAQVLFYNCESMTIRNNIFGGNTGGRIITPDAQQTSLNLKIYNNRFFTNQSSSSALIEIPSAITAGAYIRNNMIYDARGGSGNISLKFDFTNAANVRNNLIYAPSNTGINFINFIGGGTTGITFGGYLAVDASGSSASPYWVDASGGDFSIPTPTGLSLTGASGSINATIRGGSGYANFKYAAGLTPNSYNLYYSNVGSPYAITGLQNNIRYYVAGSQFDAYGYESTYGTSGFADPYLPVASLINAEILADGRVLQLTFEMDNPASYGCMDWLPGKIAGASISLTGVSSLKYMTTTYHSNVDGVTGAVYDPADNSITKTGAFTNYRTYTSGDRFALELVSGGTGNRSYTVTGKVSDDKITLLENVGATGITSITAHPMDAGQGTKLRFVSSWLISKESEVIPYTASSLTVSASAGLLQDYLGNTTNAITNYTVTNKSMVDSTGFVTPNAFTRGTGGVTLYVAPGFGSDANTYAQAQNTATPLATVNQALLLLFNNGQRGKGPRIRILEGTTDSRTLISNIAVSGESYYAPLLIDSYWDASAGVGTQGVRPKVFGFGGPQNGAATILPLWYHVFIGLEFVGDNLGASTPTQSTLEYMTFSDCIIRNHSNFILSRDTNAFGKVQSVYLNTFNIIRCVFKDMYDNTAAHNQGIYTDNVDNVLISQCHFDWAGRKGTNGGGSDIFSHSLYLDAECGRHLVWGCYLSRGDGIKNSAGGAIFECVLTEVAVGGGLLGCGGRIARCYLEKGMNFGVSGNAFNGISYNHSTKQMVGSGISSGMFPGYTYIVMGGSGISDPVQATIFSVAGFTATLTGNGLGSLADGATNIYGYRADTPRGFAFSVGNNNDIRTSHPVLVEDICVANLAMYGAFQARCLEFAPNTFTYLAPSKHIIARNVLAYNSGASQLQYTNTTIPTKIDKYQNIIYNDGSLGVNVNTLFTIVDTNHTNYSYLNARDNIYKSSNANYITAQGSNKSLTAYQAAITGEYGSFTAANISFLNATADLGAWAAYNGITGTTKALRDVLRNRAKGSWPAIANMSDCIDYMFNLYKPLGIGTTGTAPINYYGIGVTGSPYTYLFSISSGGSGGATSAYNFTRVVVLDSTVSRARLMFNYSGGSAASRSVSTTLTASDLYGYLGLTSPTATDISITKMSWCVCGTKDKALELAWGICGSMTGYPFQYVKGSGKYNFSAHGIAINNPLTGNRNNNIQITNIGDFTDTTTASLTIEISKNKGFGITSS